MDEQIARARGVDDLARIVGHPVTIEGCASGVDFVAHIPDASGRSTWFWLGSGETHERAMATARRWLSSAKGRRWLREVSP